MSPALDLGHLNDLNDVEFRQDSIGTIRNSLATSRDVPDFNDDVVKDVNAKEALKSSIFVVQKAAAPKTGVESRQSSIGTIRSSLATSYDA